MLKKDNSPLQLILLCAVVMSSLPLLAFGLNPEPGPIEIMQVPTTVAQIAFVFALALQIGVRNLFAPMTSIQRSLIGSLVVYVVFISFTSPVPSAAILAPSWIVHIFFFVALVNYFYYADPDRTEVIWTILGFTAIFHVCAFLIAWAIWPEEIRQNRLPAFDNIRHLGYLLAPAAAMVAMQFVVCRNKAILPLFSFTMAVFYILYTGSRGGAVALASGLFIAATFVVWHRKKVFSYRVFILIGVICVAIVVSEFLPPLPWKPVFGRGVDAISQTGTEMLSGRREVWNFSAIAIQQNWLWGYGPAIMGQIPEYQGLPFRHPHNIVLQVLLHWGIVGTVLITAVIMSFLPSVLKALKEQPVLSLAPLSLLATMCIHALVDGGLFYPFSTVIALIAFARLVAIGGLLHQNSSHEPWFSMAQPDRVLPNKTGDRTSLQVKVKDRAYALPRKTENTLQLASTGFASTIRFADTWGDISFQGMFPVQINSASTAFIERKPSVKNQPVRQNLSYRNKPIIRG